MLSILSIKNHTNKFVSTNPFATTEQLNMTEQLRSNLTKRFAYTR